MSGTMQNVDVLAVLDRQMGFTIASDYPGASDDHRDMVASRSAVAELIEACKYMSARSDFAEWMRFHAALEAVGGAA